MGTISFFDVKKVVTNYVNMNTRNYEVSFDNRAVLFGDSF